VEVGPGKTLSTFVRKHKQGSQTPKAVNLVRHPKEELPDAVYLLNRLGELWLYGAAIDWNAFYGGEERQRVSLPVYSFDRHYYWIEGNPFKMGAAVIQQDQAPAGIEPVPVGGPQGTPRPELSTVYAPPADETEALIAGIFREFFGFEKVGVFDDFFEMGGDSLKITAVAAHIHKALNVRLPVSDIFKAPTVRGIAQFIREAEKNIHTAIPQAETRPHYPLSSAQKRLYLFQEMDKESTGYNIYTVVLLEGELEEKKLERIFRQLIRRHESLRTSFKSIDGEPVQVIHENVPFAIDYFSAAEEKTREMVEVFVRPFNLGEAPLVRAGIIKIEDRLQQHILVLDIHHIITDGTSMGIFVTEFMALYNGEELPPLQLQYKDYAVWQKGDIGQEALKKQEAFWLKEFAGQLPVLNLPIDYDRPGIKTIAGNVLDFSFNKEVSAALKNLALKKEATLYMVLLAVFNIFLAKISDAEDIIVGIGTRGRNHTDLEPIIGMFINTLAIRNYPAGEKTVAEFLAEIKERTLKAFDNQDYQFEDLVQKAAVKRDHSRSPLFDVMFGLQNLSLPIVEIPGLTLKPYAFENKISRYDLAILGAEIEDHLAFTIEYSTRLFREETIRTFIGYFETVASAVSEDPGRKIKEIEIIAEEEKQALLSGIEKDEEAINIDFDF
jgi:acyl carrier protein